MLVADYSLCVVSVLTPELMNIKGTQEMHPWTLYPITLDLGYLFYLYLYETPQYTQSFTQQSTEYVDFNRYSKMCHN